MKCLLTAAIIAFVGLTSFYVLRSSASESETFREVAQEQTNAEMSDPEFALAQKVIEAAPNSANGHILLASLYIKKARRTSDFGLNRKADTLIDKALSLEGDNIQARKLKASLLATFHQFPEARQAALELKKQIPNDPFAYGILTDANSELGHYEEAVEAAQKMVDLKPNASSYARVGHLRSLHGDQKGALEMLKLTVETSDPLDGEAQSWALVQLGNEHFKMGEFQPAQKALAGALKISPDYTPAIIEMARVQASQGDLQGAEAMLLGNFAESPQSPAHLLLGDIYSKQGKTAEAKDQYSKAETLAHETDGDMHRFALLWADHDQRLEEALEIATKDYKTNKDIYASDILAWCYFKNGRVQDAKKVITEALRLNTNDAKIVYHAGMIEMKLGNSTLAKRYLVQALKLNPEFDLVQAEVARRALGGPA